MSQSSLINSFRQISVRMIHASAALNSSVFMKKQKKVDPEVAKLREKRKRRKLERDIRLMQRDGKTPKPVLELTVDEKTLENVDQLRRVDITLDENTIDQRAVTLKAYCKSRNKLATADNHWIRTMISEQNKALSVLKTISPTLYESAVAPDPSFLPFTTRGPVYTPPLKEYMSPDGEYTDTTPDYVENKTS
ncbi:hypothetical protein M3Y94_00364700 [Aphelenchoides besseyi]|nr:hypothetical protein M3Y94_00364700 [Aphelenchoides besseyi]KAI6235230.1 hypothetical protein M3Y95_00029500 [Aphelenchoides besseyi]